MYSLRSLLAAAALALALGTTTVLCPSQSETCKASTYSIGMQVPAKRRQF